MSNSVHAERKQKLSEYIRLIESFLSDAIDVSTFESQYLEMFKNDLILWQEVEYETLNDLFSDLDAFCADASIRDKDDLDESELRERTATALQTLKSL